MGSILTHTSGGAHAQVIQAVCMCVCVLCVWACLHVFAISLTSDVCISGIIRVESDALLLIV